MSDNEVYILIVWIIGCLINALIVSKYNSINTDKMDPLSFAICLPFIMIEYIFNGIFIISSWIGLLSVGIYKGIDYGRKKYKSIFK